MKLPLKLPFPTSTLSTHSIPFLSSSLAHGNPCFWIAIPDFSTYSLASKPLFTTTSNRTTTFYWLCYWLVLFFHYLGSFWGIWVWFCNSLVSFLLLVWFRVARLILWLASSILILWLPICYYWVPFLYLPHQSLILIGFIPSLLLTSRFLTFKAY